MSTRPADYRVIRSALAGSVSISRKRFIESAVPRFLRIGFIPSCRISPSESLRRASLLLLSEPLSCQGSVPLRDITDGVHVREPSQGPANVAVRRLSQPPDGLRHHRLCGLVASRSHVQGCHRSGGSPSAQPSWLVASPCPRVVVVRALTGKPAATLERLDFEALLRAVVRSSGSGFSLPCGRSPLRFRPPSGPGYPPWSRFPRGLHS